ncbi:very short patch repair endonuclease [Granulicella aggregans]|uniref:very short patch repair endonuclease n=1 Tax=Granulicella aggregans TaxID=474949 RepID=UPI0021E0DA9C|nr:very short patch repair endonuclease [Granulicella aggregans]
MDKLDAQRRSENMRQIRSKNTKPEVLLRSLLHQAGYRFRLHRKDLPGKPDIVFPSRRKVIFVHGCFWHQHPGCREGRMPGTRQEYWTPKLTRNVERHASAIEQLQALGWGVLTVWECEIGNATLVTDQLKAFLEPQQETLTHG